MSTIRWGGLVILIAGVVLVIVAASIGPVNTTVSPDGAAFTGARGGTSAVDAWLWVLGVIGIIVGGLMLLFGRGKKLEQPFDQLRPPTTPGPGSTP